MSSVIQCRHCGKAFHVEDEKSQETESCPQCQKPLNAASPFAPSFAINTGPPPKQPAAVLPASPDRLTPVSVVWMVLMTPAAGIAAAIAAALILVLGGGLTHVLIWITAGITALTG